MKRLLFFILFASQVAFSQVTDGEVELAGFILGQYRRTVHEQLGPPLERRKTEEGWIYEFHAIKPDTSVYALFKYPVWDTTRIYSIQLTGDQHPDELVGLRGIRLGTSIDEVTRVFGTPSKKEAVDDPPVDIHYYDHKNYSFDFDRNTGKLFGIQIYGRILEEKPLASSPELHSFRNAVLSKNVDSLISHIAPDAEFYKAGKVITYKVGARNEFENHESEMVKHLLSDSNSLLYVFRTEKASAVSERRIYNTKGDVTTVYKFPESQVINEIVFLPHAGRWKVYEVRFR